MNRIETLTFRQMDEAAAQEIVAWRYDPPYDVYNHDPTDVEASVRGLLTRDYHYYSVWDAALGLIGFVCYGEDARVPGGDYAHVDGADPLDVGWGLRPDLTGQGLGPSFIKAALRFARHRWAPPAFRATVAAFNRRGFRVCEKVGFRQVDRFERPGDRRRFVILTRQAEDPSGTV
ncbi:MAG: GNAT family N-acetyltransferase [Anaerolineae bacterium]